MNASIMDTDYPCFILLLLLLLIIVGYAVWAGILIVVLYGFFDFYDLTLAHM